jgi:hypothetical protein
VRDKIRDTVYLGIDGEGVTEVTYFEDDDTIYKIHKYQYMAAHSTAGETWELQPRDGEDQLRTEDVFWWLWKRAKNRSCWFFSGKYDWTHIFYDLLFDAEHNIDKAVLHQMFHPETNPDGSERDVFEPVRWGDWGIIYIQGAVTLCRFYANEDGSGEHRVERFFADAFRCFGGGSFISLLKSWDVGTVEQIERVTAMKEQRAHFGFITKQIREYCILEVTLLAEAVQKIAGIFNELDIRPNRGRWYSAGSAAKALLARHNIPADPKTGWEGYRGPDRYAGAPDWIADILMRTYSGGWFENAETGIFDVLYSDDLKSAYPAIIRDLPCLSHGSWHDEYSQGGLNFGHIRWEPTDEAMASTDPLRWAPAPWRWPDGRVYRPCIGQGWYCESEIRAAQRLTQYNIKELGWVSFIPTCDHKPFGWVQEVYDLRVEWGGDGRGLALKVTLNSVYGVFADTLNADSRYASIVWATLITAGTRAKILDQIADHGDKIVAVATDGILSTEPINTVKTNILGALNHEGPIYDVLLIQPGLYLARNGPDLKKQLRNRGHAIKDMKNIEDRLREAWIEAGWGASVKYDRTRLIPAKQAITRSNVLEAYGQWITQPVTVTFKPSRRDMLPDLGLRKRSTPSFQHIWFKGGELDVDSAPYNRLVSMRANERMINNKDVEDAQP